jgi:hypothetical protein
MVQLVEVEDEHFTNAQAGVEEDEDFTDTGMLGSPSAGLISYPAAQAQHVAPGERFPVPRQEPR